MHIQLPVRYKRPAQIAASLMLLCGLSFASSFVNAATTLKDGEVAVSKTAKAVDGKLNAWDITLNIQARDTKKTSDTLLIIDRSGSMGDDSKLTNAKTAAKSLVDKLLPSGNVTNKVAIASFAGVTGSSTPDVTVGALTGASNATSLKTTINNLSAGGGTFTQAAVKQSVTALNSATADYKNIILLSDGEPTYGYQPNNAVSNLSNQTIGDYDSGNCGFFTGGTVATGNATTTGLTYNYSSVVGCGSNMFYQFNNSPSRFYNLGNGAIDEMNIVKTAHPDYAVYTIALGAGTRGTPVLNSMASSGNAYTGNSTDLQSIFDKIAGNILAAAKNITISDTISDKFSIVNYDSTDGVKNGQKVTWSDVQLGAPDSDNVRSATKTIRIQLADSVDPATITGLVNTNTDVSFKYKDVDGNDQTKTAPSPKVNPVVIHTEKVLVGNKADAGDQFKVSVKDANGTDFGKTYGASGTGDSTKATLTGSYTGSETITGIGQYDSTVEYHLGGQAYTQPATFTIPAGYQNSTDTAATDNDIYVRATNTAKLGSITLHKTLGDCSQAVSTTTNGTAFTFEIKNAAGAVVATKTLTVSKDNCHASVTIDNLAQGVYTVTETGATDYATTHTVDGNTTVNNGKQTNVTVGLASNLARTVSFNNRFTVANRTITVNKTWDGGLATDHNATFELWRDGAKVVGSEKTISGNTGVSWTVPATDIYGVAYVYTVKETNVPTNYTVGCSGLTNGQCPVPTNGNVSVTDKYESPKTTFTAYKNWVGGPTTHPTIQFQLYQNSTAYGAPVSLANGTTQYTWNSLAATDTNGVVYTYTVQEVSTPANYTTTQQGNIITNTYVSPKISVTATKEWVGGPTPRPDVQFQLYRNIAGGTPAVVADAPVQTLVSGATQVAWENQAKTDGNGVDYIYSVKEITTLANYTKEENGLAVKNTYVSPKINITATKEWKDGPVNNRPEIQLQLKRGTEVVDTVTLNTTTGWTHTWQGLPETDNNGVKYVYTVNEVSVPDNYNATVSEDGLTVTNTYVIPKNATATANKAWENGPSIHPMVQFQLYRNIAGSAPAVVPDADVKALANGATSVTWTGLESTDKAGNTYSFTVREVSVPVNYTASYSDDGLTVTNSYVVPTDGSATANKIWNGGPSPRPTIWLQLYRQVGDSGEAVPGADIKELTDGTTTASWTGLERTDIRGNEYQFSVQEVNASGAPTVPANYVGEANGLTITNTYASPLTSYTAEKIWHGGPSYHPTIRMQLYRNGIAFGSPVTFANGTTKYTWTDLAQTDNDGNEYVYTIDELDLPVSYAKYIDGNRITNTYVVTPGRGGAGKTLASGSIAAPAELPMTGPHAQGSLLAILIAGFATYLGAYRIQLIRERRGQ